MIARYIRQNPDKPLLSTVAHLLISVKILIWFLNYLDRILRFTKCPVILVARKFTLVHLLDRAKGV